MKRLLGVLCLVCRAATGFASTEGQRALAALFALARSSEQSARAHCGTVLTLRDKIHGVGVLQTVVVTLAVKMLTRAAMCTCQSGTGVRRRGLPRH